MFVRPFVMFLCDVLDIFSGVLDRFYFHKLCICNSSSSVQITHKNKIGWKLWKKYQKIVKNHEYFSTMSAFQISSLRDEGMPKTIFLEISIKLNFSCFNFWKGRDHSLHKNYITMFQELQSRLQQVLDAIIMCFVEATITPVFHETHDADAKVFEQRYGFTKCHSTHRTFIGLLQGLFSVLLQLNMPSTRYIERGNSTHEAADVYEVKTMIISYNYT